jgi:hypothetical protein
MARFAELDENGTQRRDFHPFFPRDLGRKFVQPFVNGCDNLLCIGVYIHRRIRLKVALGPDAMTFPLCTSTFGAVANCHWQTFRYLKPANLPSWSCIGTGWFQQ